MQSRLKCYIVHTVFIYVRWCEVDERMSAFFFSLFSATFAPVSKCTCTLVKKKKKIVVKIRMYFLALSLSLFLSEIRYGVL